jgi:4-amino-4-deoxy-L-arabinose transferase-like glycosyltransferase
MILAAVLNLWALNRNGFANEYYSAAVRSMSTSWHDFLFASLDKTGLMTVDKPPLALWVQALSVRAFGYHPLSMLVPQALAGIASVVLVYDLVRRRFGRIGGTVAGVALALTPMALAISRHNNPDALLALCCVAAVWFAVRALEDGRTRWLVLSGVAVGLGFETKMLVALVVVPGIVAAWLWIAPSLRGRARALRQLLAGGAAMVVVGGAWPALVELTPAADRPWVSGTNDNRVLSLIFEYNGVGRVEGQTGGPAGGGPGGGGPGGLFGGSPGPLRLLNSALGGQAGWLLGFALVSGIALLLATRLRRRDERSGWLIAVGGAALVTGVLFSFAGGIFHPYYVSLLAPFVAAVTGAGVAHLLRGERHARVLGPLAVIAGVACEIAVLGAYPGQLEWLVPVLIAVGAVCAAGLALRARVARRVALAAASLALLLGPAIWSVDTLGYATSGTFPAGGPALTSLADGAPFAGRGARARRFFLRAGTRPLGGLPRLPGTSTRAPLFPGAAPTGPGGPQEGGGAAAGPGGPPPGGGRGFGGAAGGAPFGDDASLTRVLGYISRHGGGTLAVTSQSSAATAITSRDANVAGIGGFSGRESSVSVAWLSQRVRSGAIRWVLAEAGTAGPRLPGDTRSGSRAALSDVARACRAVQVSLGSAAAASNTASSNAVGQAAARATVAASTATVYDCAGRSQALLAAVAGA